MNGRTLTVDSDPKKTKSSAIKALKFLASSHLAQKPLDCTMQKEKQTEPHRPCDTWPLSSPCWLVAWKSLDSSFHSAQEEAPSSEDVPMEAAAVPMVLPLTDQFPSDGQSLVCIRAPAQFLQPATSGHEWTRAGMKGHAVGEQDGAVNVTPSTYKAVGDSDPAQN